MEPTPGIRDQNTDKMLGLLYKMQHGFYTGSTPNINLLSQIEDRIHEMQDKLLIVRYQCMNLMLLSCYSE